MQHCLLHAPCHAHSKGHSKPLTDLEWKTPSCLRRSFMITLMRIFFGKFHAFVNLATFEEKPFSLKKDVITASPSLDPDFSNPFNGTNYFAVCNHIVLPNIVRFSNFASRLLKISIKFDSNNNNNWQISALPVLNSFLGLRFSTALLPRLFGKNPRSHPVTTRAPLVEFELETNGFQFYAIQDDCQLGQDIPALAAAENQTSIKNTKRPFGGLKHLPPQGKICLLLSLDYSSFQYWATLFYLELRIYFFPYQIFFELVNQNEGACRRYAIQQRCWQGNKKQSVLRTLQSILSIKALLLLQSLSILNKMSTQSARHRLSSTLRSLSRAAPRGKYLYFGVKFSLITRQYKSIFSCFSSSSWPSCARRA